MRELKSVLIPWYNFPPFGKYRAGGVSITMWELSQNLAKLGFHIDYLVPPTLSDSTEEKEGEGFTRKVHISKLANKILKGGNPSNEDLRFLETYDILLSVNNFGAKFFGRLRTKDSVVRIVHTSAHDTQLESYLGLKSNPIEYLRMLNLRRKQKEEESKLRGTKTICVSKYLVHVMQKFNLEISKNLEHCPNGIDTSLFFRKGVEKRYDILFIGRFERAKGLDLLMSALRILQANDNAKFRRVAIVGNFEDAQKKFCLSLASRDLRGKIEFLGRLQREDMPLVMNSSRLLVAPSRNESFGLSILEALSCGTPIVATNVGGIPELATDRNTPIFLTDFERSEELSNLISQALEDTSLADRSLTAGPEAAKKYDWHNVIERFVSMLPL